MINSKRAWVVRTHPHHIPRIAEFLHRDLIALGWPGIGNLARKNRDQITLALRKTYRNEDAHWIGSAAGSLDAFINQMSEGHRVLIPSPEDGAVYVAELRGGYQFRKSKDNEEEGFPHQRKVTWLLNKSRIPRQTLPLTLIRSLRAQQPIFSVDPKAVDGVISGLLAHAHDFQDVDTDQHALEGQEACFLGRRRRRDQKLRDLKIRQALAAGRGRLICEVPGCGFDFEAVYGELGKGFAHIHHREQFKGTRGQRMTQVRDLAVICANCHAMIHRHGACRSIEGLISRRRPH